MIPTHQSNKANESKIVLNRLSTLNDYDFSNAHRHDYFEFFCFVEGGGTHTIDFKDVVIQSYSMHIVAPGQVHQVNRALDSHGFVFLFRQEALAAPNEITGFLFDHICHDLDGHIPEYLVPADKKEWFQLFLNSLWDTYNAEDSFSNLNIRIGVQQLAVKCMQWDNQESSLDSSEYATFRRLVFNNFKKLKKVKEYASLMNITEKTLNELVKKNNGKSASKVIYDQIVLEAKRLLMTGMSAKSTAYDLGFDDPAHFSKFFKKQTESSPSDFRKVHVEG